MGKERCYRTCSGRLSFSVVLLSLLPVLSLASPLTLPAAKTTETVSIATLQLVDGKRGLTYSQQLAVSGGKAPYSWSVEKGTRLPMGLNLDQATGVISGYPVREGFTPTTLRVTDSTGSTATRTFTLNVMLVPGELWSWLPDASALPIDEMDGVIAAAEGDGHYAALRYDGTVWTWGKNHGNQLGRDGKLPGKVVIPGIDNAVAIAAGKEHTTVLTADGTIKEFGNYWGAPRSFVEQGIVALSGGDYYTIALKEDGTVWTWLYDETPRQLSGFPKIVAIAAGRSYLGGTPDLALAEDGTVWTWTFKAPRPARLSAPTDVVAIANTNGAYLLKADGTVYGTTLNGAIAVSETGTIHQDGSVWYHPDHGKPARIAELNGATAITRTTALVPYNSPTLLSVTHPLASGDSYSQAIARTDLP